MSITDPREKISHPIEIGQVYADARTDDELLLVYADANIVITRDRSGNHRLSQRRDFDKNVGAGRFALQPDAESFGETGRLQRVVRRTEEYAEMGGRKHNHYAEAMREAITILTDEGAEDAREPVPFEDVSGVGESTASALRSAGVRNRRDVRGASDEELLAISGVGEKNLAAIRDRVA